MEKVSNEGEWLENEEEYEGVEITEEDWFLPEKKYEHMDHPADIILHAWGSDLKEAFEQCASAMFDYITDLNYVEMKRTRDITAEGHDIQSLLFHFLDEFLYEFSAESNFIPRKVHILEFDKENFKITARGFGETFEIGKHPQNCEVKAITYCNMEIKTDEGCADVYVTVDI